MVSVDVKHHVYLLTGGSDLDLMFHRPGSMSVFRPQVRENCLVASKLNCHLFRCCVVYALMYDTMYVLISRILIATCSGCLFGHVAAMNNIMVEGQIE